MPSKSRAPLVRAALPCCAKTAWRRRWRRPAPRRSRGTRCCCRRPAPASTCSAITSIAARYSPDACERYPMLSYIKAERTSAAEFDGPLVWTALMLLVLGMVMVYSASIATAEASRFTGNQPAYFLVRHALFLGVSLIAALMAFQVPVRAWQSLAPWLFVFGIVALVLVLIPGVGREVNGAKRWLSLGLVNLQPSEFMKVSAVLYASDYTARKSALMHSFKKGLLPMLAVMLVVGWLLLREPDFDAFVVIASIAMAILL